MTSITERILETAGGGIENLNGLSECLCRGVPPRVQDVIEQGMKSVPFLAGLLRPSLIDCRRMNSSAIEFSRFVFYPVCDVGEPSSDRQAQHFAHYIGRQLPPVLVAPN